MGLIMALIITYPLLLSGVVISGRLHGIGTLKHGRWLSYVLLGLGLFVFSKVLYGWEYAAISTAIALWGFSLGHGNFYQMKGVALLADDPELIEKLGVRWFSQKFFGPFSIYHPAYSWGCMGLKWLIVSLPIMPYAAPMAVLGPLAYAIGFGLTPTTTKVADWLKTAFLAFFMGLVFVANIPSFADELGGAASVLPAFFQGGF
jgi:hypothetical protein